MPFKLQWHIGKVLLQLRLGPGLSSISPFCETERLYNEVANHILIIATKRDRA